MVELWVVRYRQLKNLDDLVFLDISRRQFIHGKGELLNFVIHSGYTDLSGFSQNAAILGKFLNPKIAHLIFILEMRTFDFRFEKQQFFIFTNI